MIPQVVAVKVAAFLLAATFLIFGLEGEIEVDIDIDRITEQAETDIIDHVNENYLDFVNEDANIVILEEIVFEQIMDKLLDIHEVPEEMTEDVMDKVWENLRPDLWQRAQYKATEQYRDYIMIERDPLGYNGMSQRDFL